MVPPEAENFETSTFRCISPTTKKMILFVPPLITDSEAYIA